MNVVTFGEMLLRLSPPDGETLLASPELRTNFGGCEANVAVALAHLGVRATYVTALPDNPIGDAALNALRAEGVDTNSVLRSGARMPLYYVELGDGARPPRVIYDRAHSALATAAPSAFQWDTLLPSASWFHGSGITPALGDNAIESLATAIASARAHNVPVSIDLNYRAALWRDRDPAPIIAPLVRNIDLLLANAVAVRSMLGYDVGDDATATPAGALGLARRLAADIGVKRVALTRREILSENEHRWSASLYDATSDAFASTTPRNVRVVDRVGGGDCFAAALIAATLRKQQLDNALRFAVAGGALKLSVRGDFSRATTRDVEGVLAQWN